jgi:hypothetical protein
MPGNRLGRVRWMVLSTSRVENLGRRIISPPAITLRFMHVVMPYTWKNGMTLRKRASPSRIWGIQARHWRVLATRLRWVRMTPFGTPVVPPVYWSRATSSAAGRTAGGVIAAAASRRSMSWAGGCFSNGRHMPSRLAFTG